MAHLEAGRSSRRVRLLRVTRRTPSQREHSRSLRAPIEKIAAAVSLVGILLPVSGAIQRTIAFWASGRVPPGLGAAAPVSDLAIQGAAGSLSAVAAVTLVASVLAWEKLRRESADAMRRSAFVRGANRIAARFASSSAEQKPEPSRVPLSQRYPVAAQWISRTGVSSRFPTGVVARHRRTIVAVLAVLGIVIIGVLPSWAALAVIAYFLYVLAILYLIEARKQPVMIDLAAWAILLVVLSALLGGLAPRPELAPTVEIVFSPNAGLAAGRYSLVGSHDGTLSLLECPPGDRLIEVQSSNTTVVQYVAQPPPPWTGNDAWKNFLPWDAKYREVWTPLVLVGSEPWKLGYVQWC